jgi:drug/metabolite transporter (DMT)-like permease
MFDGVLVGLEKIMQATKNTFISPLLGLFIGILAVSSASLFIRFAQKEAPSLVIAAFRMGLAALVVTPFCIRNFRKEIRAATSKTRLLLLLSGLFLAFHFVVWITSLEYTSVASSVVLVTTAPLWVALLSPVILKEKITKWILLGLVVSLTGSVVVSFSSSCGFQNGQFACQDLSATFHGKAFLGNAMALAGAFLSAGYLMVGRKVREHVSLSSYIFSVYSVAAIVLFMLVLVTGQNITGYSTQIYIWMVVLAFIPQIIGHSAFNWALKYLSAAYVSIALLGEPVGTVILTMLFLHESPAILELIGGILILAGIALATLSQKGTQTLTEDLP